MAAAAVKSLITAALRDKGRAAAADSLPVMRSDAALTDWLLDSDPALRWQVERDLAAAPRDAAGGAGTRNPPGGVWGQVPELQDPLGQGAGGSRLPGWPAVPGPGGGAGQRWTATTWTLNPRRDWGLDASALAGPADLLAANSRWEYDGLPYWGGEVDCCINAYTLANGAWLGADVSALAEWFPAHRM